MTRRRSTVYISLFTYLVSTYLVRDVFGHLLARNMDFSNFCTCFFSFFFSFFLPLLFENKRDIYTRPLLSFFFLKRILDRIAKTRLPFLRVLASRSMFPPYIIRRNKRRESELVKRWLISRSRWFNRWWKKWNLYRRTFAPENSDFTEFFFPLLLFI